MVVSQLSQVLTGCTFSHWLCEKLFPERDSFGELVARLVGDARGEQERERPTGLSHSSIDHDSGASKECLPQLVGPWS